ncbi:MAG: hypothetical protein WAN18_20070, partial [Candidatus Sulfotelmatobacter sp.]
MRIVIDRLGICFVLVLLLALVTRAQETVPAAEPQPQAQTKSSPPSSEPSNKAHGNGDSEIKKQEQTGTSADGSCSIPTSRFNEACAKTPSVLTPCRHAPP